MPGAPSRVMAWNKFWLHSKRNCSPWLPVRQSCTNQAASSLSSTRRTWTGQSTAVRTRGSTVSAISPRQGVGQLISMPLHIGGFCESVRASLQIKRVHEEFVRAMRLPPPLRPEAQQNHVAFAVIDVQRRRFPLDFPRADQVSAGQRVAVFRIARQNRALELGLRIEGGAA